MKILEMKKERECDRDEGSGRERKKKKNEREERKSQKEERENFFFFSFSIFIHTVPKMERYCLCVPKIITFGKSYRRGFWCLVCQMSNIWHLAHLIRMLSKVTLRQRTNQTSL